MSASPSPSIPALAALARAPGFTLLEVLVAVLVVAFGVLGMARLQTVGLSGSKHARIRAMAALQSESLAASLRALPTFWAGAPQDFSMQAGHVFLAGGTVPLAPGADCSAADCSDAEFALFELQRWATSMNAQFPGHTARVTCGPGLPRQCTVRVQWSERPLLARNAALAAGADSTVVQTFVLHVLP